MRLTDEQKKEILAIKDDDITKSLFIRLFGRTVEQPEPRFKPNDSFLLAKGETPSYNELNPVKTTIGRFLFNRFLNESIFGKTIPYYNGNSYQVFDKMVMNQALMGNIDPKQMNIYQTKRNWLMFTPVEILVPGLSFNVMAPNPIVQKRKKELFKQYEKEIAAGDVNTVKKIEDELIELAKEINKDDPAMRLYTSCKKPSIGNNYKNMTIMVGALKSNTDGSFSISENSYMEGIDKEEYPKFADQLVTGSYSRSVDTQVGGALVKEFQSALQSETTDTNVNSDCHTNLTLPITFSKDLAEMALWKYIVENGKLVQITPENVNQYVDKPLKMRSPMFCNGKSYCAKCAGTMFARLGVKNAGLTCAQVGSRIQSLSMKAMHDKTIKTTEFNFEDYFKDF